MSKNIDRRSELIIFIEPVAAWSNTVCLQAVEILHNGEYQQYIKAAQSEPVTDLEILKRFSSSDGSYLGKIYYDNIEQCSQLHLIHEELENVKFVPVGIPPVNNFLILDSQGIFSNLSKSTNLADIEEIHIAKPLAEFKLSAEDLSNDSSELHHESGYSLICKKKRTSNTLNIKIMADKDSIDDMQYKILVTDSEGLIQVLPAANMKAAFYVEDWISPFIIKLFA